MKFIDVNFFIFMYMGFCLHVCLSTYMCMELLEAKTWCQISWNWSCVSPHVGAGIELDPLEEQQML